MISSDLLDSFSELSPQVQSEMVL